MEYWFEIRTQFWIREPDDLIDDYLQALTTYELLHLESHLQMVV
jgi:hypothetical protein